jgi:5'-nucleotidase
MHILLTNDDGYRSPGLHALALELKKLGKVTVVAPSSQKSAISSSLTLYTPLMSRKRREEGLEIHAVDGTPADCVKLAVREFLPSPPDLVVSGINFGLNTGSNILYSGTVAGALEGAHLGLPAFAVSLQVSGKPAWSRAAADARKVIEKLIADGIPERTVYNVNLPKRKPMGVRVAVQERRPYPDFYERRTDPRGRTYFWLCGNPEKNLAPSRNGNGEEPTDAWVVSRGYISVTPLVRDLTHHEGLEETRRLLGHKRGR